MMVMEERLRSKSNHSPLSSTEVDRRRKRDWLTDRETDRQAERAERQTGRDRRK